MDQYKDDKTDMTGQKADEISREILTMIGGSPQDFRKYDKDVLSPKLRNLISLAASLAFQRSQEIVSSCVIDCCKTGANSEEIMEVLRLAILMAEIPAEEYTAMVQIAIAHFHNQTGV